MNGCYHPHYPPPFPPPPPPPYYPIPGGSCVKPVINEFTDELKEKLEHIEDYANNYVLPPASENELGGIVAGDGLAVDESGVLSVDAEKIAASIPIGEGLKIDDAGSISVDMEQVLDPDEIVYLDGGSAGGF